MRILFNIIFVLLISFPGYCQSEDLKALVYYRNGCDKIFSKNYTGAITEFTWAIKRDSVFIQAYENRGVAKYYLENYQGAVADFDKALEINPYDYSTFGRRGWAKFHLQDCRGAIDDFSRAIEGDRDPSQYYNIRGQAKYYLHDYEGAINDFTRVIRSWYGERSQRGKAFFWRGLVKIDTGQRNSGCLDLRKAGKLGYAKALEMVEIYCQ
jgi:tetratricopeptide (TPR) repeat protein